MDNRSLVPHCNVTIFKISILCSFLWSSFALSIEEGHDVAVNSSPQRQKICLALSGGGARGAAHVGVLKLLEELRVPIDCIAGTSMGSIIGGLYASGKRSAEIEQDLAHMDWDNIFDDSPPREERSLRRKSDDRYYVIDAKPGISDTGEVKFPTGAIQGQKFDLALRALTLPVSTITDFDKLSIPYRAIATNIGNGQKVVLSDGDLATAMRASMAVPGAFAAVPHSNNLLVDGGLTDNLPIDIARDMGADIVIAVDISSPYIPAEQVKDMFTITAQMTSIMTRTNAEQQIATLKKEDILIIPDLGDITSADFNKSPQAIGKGYTSALALRQKLSLLSLSPQEYDRYLTSRRLSKSPHQQIDPVIEFVRIKNDSSISDDVIASHISQPLGQPLNRKQLERDISTLYGQEIYQTVGYDLVQEHGKTGLEVKAKKRDWGPNYLQLGIELSNAISQDDSYNFMLAYQRTAINKLSGELRGVLQLGADPSITLEWYQPLDVYNHNFFDGTLKYGSFDISQYEQEQKITEYQITETKMDTAAGHEFDSFGELRAGYRIQTGHADVVTGSPDTSSFGYKTARIYIRPMADHLDNLNFPSSGWLSSVEYSRAAQEIGSDSDFDQLNWRGSHFFQVDNSNIIGLIGQTNMTTNGTAPIQNQYRFGGFLKLSGYVDESLSGQQTGMLGAIYYRHFRMMPFFSCYIGSSLEYGGTWEKLSSFGSEPIAAGSLFVGANTPLGPLYLGWGLAENNHSSLFFYLGKPMLN